LIREESMVDFAGGVVTATATPQRESVVVTLVPVGEVDVALAGKLLPAEMVKELVSLGMDFVAAVVHFST